MLAGGSHVLGRAEPVATRLIPGSHPAFFFLMIRRPPRSTPFPTRRSSDLRHRPARPGRPRARERRARRRRPRRQRSEGHTSGLQSPCNLVCRLLLEKNNMRAATATTPLLQDITIFIVYVL